MEEVKKNSPSPWFKTWFNSPFYHVLYKNRDEVEAKIFIKNLIQFLQPNPNDKFVDVACGKGRHAMYLNTLGYDVDGFDLAENSIEAAKKHENAKLHFYTNDIRNPLKKNHYNFAFNLFTSFGYFDDEKENQKAIDAVSQSLIENGVLVLDFMNCNNVVKNLNKEEVKTIDGIDFKIKRAYKNGYIHKDIKFVANKKKYQFQEQVKAISLNTFNTYFEQSNLTIEFVLGDYELNNFDIDNSERLILIARKK